MDMNMKSKSDSTPGESQNREAEDEEHREELELETRSGQFQTLKLKEPGTGPGQDGIGLIGIDEDGEAGSKIMNSALLVDLIASKLPVKDLFKLRQTCKIWNSTFILHIRKIHKPIKLLVSLSANIWSRERSLSDFVDAFQHRAEGEEELPFASYRLEPGYLGLSSDDDSDLGSDFRRGGRSRTLALACKIGTFITRLDLAHWCEDYVPPIADFRKLIFESTPRLEELTLAVYTPLGVTYVNEEPQPELGNKKFLQKLKRLTVKRIDDDDNRSFTAFVQDIVQEAKHLTYLKLGPQMPFPLPLLSGLQNSGHASKLKTLKLSLVSAAVLQQLANMAKIGLTQLQSVQLNLKLGSAELDERNQHEAARHFQNFLEYQAATLRKLKISTNCYTWNSNDGAASAHDRLEPVFLIPPMKQLHTLKLACDEFGFLKLKFGGDNTSSFEETFPALRSLVTYPLFNVVNIVKRTREYARAMAEISHSQVTQLEVYAISAEEVNEVARLAAFGGFPAVTDLNVICWGVQRAWPSPEVARKLCPGLVTFNGCKMKSLVHQREQESDDETETDP